MQAVHRARTEHAQGASGASDSRMCTWAWSAGLVVGTQQSRQVTVRGRRSMHLWSVASGTAHPCTTVHSPVYFSNTNAPPLSSSQPPRALNTTHACSMDDVLPGLLDEQNGDAIARSCDIYAPSWTSTASSSSPSWRSPRGTSLPETTTSSRYPSRPQRRRRGSARRSHCEHDTLR